MLFFSLFPWSFTRSISYLSNPTSVSPPAPLSPDDPPPMPPFSDPSLPFSDPSICSFKYLRLLRLYLECLSWLVGWDNNNDDDDDEDNIPFRLRWCLLIFWCCLLELPNCFLRSRILWLCRFWLFRLRGLFGWFGWFGWFRRLDDLFRGRRGSALGRGEGSEKSDGVLSDREYPV